MFITSLQSATFLTHRLCFPFVPSFFVLPISFPYLLNSLRFLILILILYLLHSYPLLLILLNSLFHVLYFIFSISYCLFYLFSISFLLLNFSTILIFLLIIHTIFYFLITLF